MRNRTSCMKFESSQKVRKKIKMIFFAKIIKFLPTLHLHCALTNDSRINSKSLTFSLNSHLTSETIKTSKIIFINNLQQF